MDISSTIKEILEKGYLLSLATLDEKGVWAADVIYVSDDSYNIYWISRKDARHSTAIQQHPQTAGTITLSNNPNEKDLGLQIEGTAEQLTDPKDIPQKYWMKRNKPQKPLTEDQAWYKLKPTRIELIHQELLGYEKKIMHF